MNITRREAFRIGIFAALATLLGRFIPKVEALTVPGVPLPPIKWEYLPTCKELNAMLAELRPHYAGIKALAHGGPETFGRPIFTKGRWITQQGSFPVHEDLSRRLRM